MNAMPWPLLAGAKAIGLQPAAEEGYRAPMLTTLRIPDGIDDTTIRQRLIADYGIEIGAGLGIFAGKAWRIGLMGESANQRNVMLVLDALEKLLIESGHDVARGTAVHGGIASLFRIRDLAVLFPLNRAGRF